MEQKRKYLKLTSIVVLIFAGLSLVNSVAEIIWGEVNRATIPDGAPTNILLITKIFLLVVSVLLLWPQVYIGVKGLKIAKTPDSSKGHIVWAIILFVFSVVSLISPIVGIVTKTAVGENTAELFIFALEALIFFDYIQFASGVAKGN